MNKAKRDTYRALMARDTTAGLGVEETLVHIERLTAVSFDLGKPEGTEQAVRLGEELDARPLYPIHRATLHFCMANAWENLRLMRGRGKERTWDWEQAEVEQELMHLRRAFVPGTMRQMPREHTSRMLSNMATLLNHVGRFSEAVERWDNAIAWSPGFPMARAKRGYALTHYAHVLYDREQVQTFLRTARSDLAEAVDASLPASAKEQFRRRLAWVEARITDMDKDRDLFSPHLGAGDEELYRRWCLEHRLFLNPMNDLGPFPAGARDSLAPPPFQAARSARAAYHGYLNQIKQAYVSARYLYYEGLNASAPHYSDRGVLLFDTRDYPSYSLSVEKMKAAFTMAYSLMDRIADFLDRYLDLGIIPGAATLRTVWYRGQRRRNGLRDELLSRKNWPLRGLFWLSKDLYEDDPGFREAIEPEARELSDIRLCLDRSYLKLHDELPSRDTSRPPDPMALSLLRGDFEAKTLRLLKMARAAQMYLTLAIHVEEKQKKDDALNAAVPTLRLDPLDEKSRI